MLVRSLKDIDFIFNSSGRKVLFCRI